MMMMSYLYLEGESWFLFFCKHLLAVNTDGWCWYCVCCGENLMMSQQHRRVVSRHDFPHQPPYHSPHHVGTSTSSTTRNRSSSNCTHIK
jgi:hypothetical protein